MALVAPLAEKQRFCFTKFIPHVACDSLAPATAAARYDIEKIAKSTQGHVVIRVEPGGASYRVLVLDDSRQAMRVKAVFGAYASN